MSALSQDELEEIEHCLDMSLKIDCPDVFDFASPDGCDLPEFLLIHSVVGSLVGWFFTLFHFFLKTFYLYLLFV